METSNTETVPVEPVQSESRSKMGLWFFIFLFCLFYTSTFCGAYVFIDATGVTPSSNLNTLFLIGSAAIVRWIFKREYRRTFLFPEYRVILICSVVFDCILQNGTALYYFGSPAFAGNI